VLRLAVILLLAALPARAQLYGEDELASARRQSARVAEMLTEEVPATLPRGERARAASIRPAFPVRLGGHPLGVFAEPARNTVHVPLETLRFLDDFALLLGWDNVRGCQSEYIDSYLYALLREGRRLDPPLTAFGIDREAAIADAQVDFLGQAILKSQMFFLLAHEIGHILLGHDPRAGGAASQAQELAADAFALDRFAALGTAPLGMAAYFYAARYLDPTGAASEMGSHPVFSDRLTALADRLASEPEAFSFAEPEPAQAQETVLYVAGELRRMAMLGGDDDMLDVLPQALLRDYPLSRLGEACAR
jgi:hypothetical protein